ncbi:hypothetical protein, partial [Xanthomonas hortorum]|uniref:hypothetical protein n=1 Tax=Xanthomonas hortorum TaxID=56454 RepID=UPI001F28D74C
EDLPASLLALAQALSVTERQLHGSLLNMGVVSLICGALFRGSLEGQMIELVVLAHHLRPFTFPCERP